MGVATIGRLTTNGAILEIDAWTEEIASGLERALTITASPPLQVRVTPTGVQLACSVPAPARLAKTDSSGISARSGSTLGTGTVVLQDLAPDGELTSETVEESAFNLSTTAIAANTFVVITRIGKHWLVTVEDCPS